MGRDYLMQFWNFPPMENHSFCNGSAATFSQIVHEFHNFDTLHVLPRIILAHCEGFTGRRSTKRPMILSLATQTAS